MIKVISVKDDMPPADYAIHTLLEEIKVCKLDGTDVLVVIHGYGSHGVGGVIKKRVNDELIVLKQHKVIRDYVKGEHWGTTNETVQKIVSACPEVLVHNQLQVSNSGISVILI